MISVNKILINVKDFKLCMINIFINVELKDGKRVEKRGMGLVLKKHLDIQ
jgi:hypothetical protein